MKKLNRVAVVHDLRLANMVTHLAPHQADEVFVIAILSFLSEVRVLRTDDAETIANATRLRREIRIYDIRDKYGLSAKKIWRENGSKILLKFECPAEWVDEAILVVKNELLSEIQDRSKNGIMNNQSDSAIKKVSSAFDKISKDTSISTMIDLFNPNWDEKQDVDEAFLKAVKFAQEILSRKIKRTVAIFKAKTKISELIGLCEGRILVMPEFIGGNWIVNVLSDPNPKAAQFYFGVYPGLFGEWMAQAIPPARDRMRNKKKPFPKAWWGLSGQKLVKITGVETAIFCHPNGYIAGAKTQEDAIRLANLAIDES